MLWLKPGAALNKVLACVSHGVQDEKLGIHFGRNAKKQVLTGYGVPLDYHDFQAYHALSIAMVGDFKQWMAAQF